MTTGLQLPERSASGGIPLLLRPDLDILPVQTIHGAGWLLRDPLRLSYFEVSPAGLRFLQLLNGWRSLSDLQQALQQEFPGEQITAEDLLGLQRSALQAGLLRTIWPRRSVFGVSAGGAEHACSKSAAVGFESWQSARNLLSRWGLQRLSFRWRGPDPTPLLNWLVPRLQRAWHPRIAQVLCGFVLLAFTAVLLSLSQLRSELPDLAALLTVSNLLALAVAVTVARVLHELGHAIACRWFGGECHELGVMVIVFFPLLYCDVSDSRRFPTSQRILVAAAGIVAELLIAAVSAVLWLLSYPGFLHSLFLNLLLFCSLNTLLINGNPLMRYDGYYVLSDMLAIPNLWQQAAGAARRAGCRILLGPARVADDALPVTPVAAAGLALLGAAMLVWRVSATLTLLIVLYRLLEPAGLESAVVLPASASLLLGLPGLAAGVRNRVSEAVSPARARRGLWATVGVVLVLLCVPFSWPASVPCVLTPGRAAAVYAKAPGELVWSIAAGSVVRAGDVLAEFRNAELEQQLAAAQGLRTQRQATVRSLQNRQFAESTAAAALPAAEESLKAADERYQTLRAAYGELTLRSPRAGVVLQPRNVPAAVDDGETVRTWDRYVLDSGTVGAWVEPQTLVCWVGDAGDLRVVAMSEQSDVERLQSAGAEARVILFARTDMRLAAAVESVGTSPVPAVDRELISAGLVAARPDGSPLQPLFATQLALTAASPSSDPLVAGLPPLYSVGIARIPTKPASLLGRAWRLARRTFRVPALQ